MNKTQSKEEIKKLLIYLGITFAISWVIFFSFILPGNSFLDESGNLSGIGNLICTLGMLCPSIGVIITRYITKEGYILTGDGSIMLGIDMKNRKYIFYILAILLPWIYTELGNLLKIIIKPECFDKEFFNTAVTDVRNAYMFPLMAIVSGVFFSIGGLGEELGWRGYMMPKLIKICGTGKAVLTGGIIWGVWHWPLTYVGHNFGTDYKGYPFLGFADMCILCIVMGIVLSYITVKSGSVWPAAVMHAVNNTSPSVLQFFINNERITGVLSNPGIGFFIHYIPLSVISIIILIYWLKNKNKINEVI